MLGYAIEVSLTHVFLGKFGCVLDGETSKPINGHTILASRFLRVRDIIKLFLIITACFELTTFTLLLTFGKSMRSIDLSDTRHSHLSFTALVLTSLSKFASRL